MGKMGGKVLLLGLDSAPPELLFQEFRDDLPNIKALMESSVYGRLRTIEPPITIPAWMCMATSKSPGQLGMYGFRHRKGNSYTDFWIANSTSVREKTLWQVLSENRRSSCLVGVPPTYPPQEIKGNLISCFITPSNKNYTYPPELKDEIEALVGDYIFDVVFRTEEREKLLKGIYEMAEKRFQVIKYLMKNKPWSLFMSVEIGLDRLHHAFWKYFDSEHHLYEPGSKYEDVVRNFYIYLDRKIGEILELMDEETTLIIASDHGTKRMKGCFCINEWLIQEGYLVLRKRPRSPVELGKAEIDWSRTKAWAWGGYYSRIFVNLEGREEKGSVRQSEYEDFIGELKERLTTLPGPQGETVKNRIKTPEELYGVCRGDAPDLMASFDDYYLRAAGTIGHNTLYLSENDTGPDDSMHSMDGVILIHRPETSSAREIKASIYDVAPTILHILGLENGIEDPQGRVIKEVLG